jgi:hypothetical protein
MKKANPNAKEQLVHWNLSRSFSAAEAGAGDHLF